MELVIKSQIMRVSEKVENKDKAFCNACELRIEIKRGFCDPQVGKVYLNRLNKTGMVEMLSADEPDGVKEFVLEAKGDQLLAPRCKSTKLTEKIVSMLANIN